jgi:glycosyltransferase involved in cell wall biosynthesis
MKKILLFSKYSRLGASSRLRTHQYIPFLEAKGYKVTISPLFSDRYLQALYAKGKVSKLLIIYSYLNRIITILKCHRFDLIWIEKELFPYFPSCFEFLLNRLGLKFIVDYDDAIFHNYDMSGNPLIRRFLANKIDKVMALSTATISGNKYLFDRATKAGAPKNVIIPTVVDTNRYSNNPLNETELVIGWIGSPSTQKYVIDLLPAFRTLSKKFPFKLHLIGATDDVKNQLIGVDVDVIPWSEYTEVSSIQKMDIGIMPLQDGPWEQGKCGYKLIQYMACGIPVVASPVGVNCEIVMDNKCGLIASTVDEWVLQLSKLINDRQLRACYGKNALFSVEHKYSLQSQSQYVYDIISQSVSS